MGCGDSKVVTPHQNKSKSAKGGTISSKTKEQTRETTRKIEKDDQRPKSEKENPYKQIDEHARKAPNSLKNSADDLVNYLSSVSKEPRMLVRGFFVWISENIKYDVDGYFGRAKRAPYDSEGVMKCGKSVCGGYANVMEELCRKANIHVKNISGFAKGHGYSADQVITESSKTDHAWNAVELEGKWYLIDSTWGAGHLNKSKEFEKNIRRVLLPRKS